MPSAKVLEQKQQVVCELAEKLKNATAGVLFDYKGITVEADTKLRSLLREAGVEYSVVKNTLMRFAVNQIGYEGLIPVLEGTTALAISSDPVLAAKILSKAADDSKGKFKIKAGFVDGNVIDAKGVSELAKLPSREVLISRMLGGLNAPITGFVNVLNGNLRGLVVALNAIKEQKSA